MRAAAVGTMRSMTALELRPEPGSVVAARAFVRAELSLDCPDELVDTATLLTSELVTNAVLHARTMVRLTVELVRDGVRIAVTDGSPARPVVRSYGTDAPTGRGMQLVERLARRWGVDSVDGNGKTVWFELTPDALAAGARSD